jgi:hypothetical protein
MMHDQGVETWYSGTLRICDIISGQAEIRKLFNLSSQCPTRKLNMIKKGFFFNKWNSVRETTISNSGKLRNCFPFKSKFGCENYLNLIKDHKQRRAFLKFRISNHRLQIETGRYVKPKIVPEDRICKKCYSSEVEDEQHFFFKLNCGFYHNHRNKLFEAIKLTCKFENFKLLSSLNKLIWLLNSENINILTEICYFCLKVTAYLTND